MPHLSDRVSSILQGGKTGWEVHFHALARRQAGEDILMVTAGDHDFDTPAEIVAACDRALHAGYHHYTQLEGIPALRRAMARVSEELTGVATRPDNILATGGGQGALYAAVQAVCDPGSHAVVCAPYYATYPGTFRAAGADFSLVHARPEDGFQPGAEAIEAAVTERTTAILINTPNNPAGAIYSRETLNGIADVCRRHDLWLLSDEVYWSHTGDQAHLSPRSLPDMAERTLVINSMSKSHGMTGWRVGWLTGPESVIGPLVGLNLVSTYGLNDFVSHAAVEALDQAYGVAEITAVYARRRAAFRAAMDDCPGLLIRGSEGGIYLMADIRAVSADGEAFAWGLLESENLALMPGETFGPSTAGHVRVSLCQPDDVLEEAARRIRRHVDSLLAKKRGAA
ncbi:aspartate aminotransferase [Zhengella mangrovi]|uniref:Aminotransferase n=1 Tax=Zhengella mangrovi TaxID=1982044 RepID=A0A2G1QLL5_9HYPH|nr:pyridoxal phosphate-dependent aminotransferase [Zhengella mangrovi]PHP66392.1 aspartate aminotransferase [Zhengella mangrovi]